LPLATAIGALTSGPAGVLGLERGNLGPGAVADVCIFDPGGTTRLQESTMISAGKNTPFLGMDLPGVVTHTLVAGAVVYERA